MVEIHNLKYTIFPIGSSALTIDFGNNFDDTLFEYITFLNDFLKKNAILGFKESISAYTSISVFYDLRQIKKTHKTVFESFQSWIETCIEATKRQVYESQVGRQITIPVIYDGEDLASVALHNHLSIEEVIRIHTEAEYKVYMIGFLPGFAYMGGMNERIATPRRKTPRLKVPAGSVGIAGKQTGIYPLESPGGWQLIGRTPLNLFTPFESSPTLLKAGDSVRFVAIND